jgi:NAD(P)-dependent dehydrogenase (short-subunit alcohol dehydrogenase family)
VNGLAGKVAFVAGAARAPGMGRATALRLAREGVDVACVDLLRDEASGDSTGGAAPESLEAVAAEVRAQGRRAVAIPCDLTDEAGVERAVETAVDELGTIDLCCNFAGATGADYGNGPLLDIDAASWERTMALNLTATWLASRACARRMIEHGRGGAIVNLSSYAARFGTPGFGALSAARAGVLRLTETLAIELAPHGIRVNAVCPLGVRPTGSGGNPGLERLAAGASGSLDAWVRATIPLGRMQEPGETAAVAVFLCSDDASFVTGEAITVAGGARP